jgi:IclR family acetate operon transcriptional repressor
VQAVSRAVALLRAFESAEELTLAELAARIELPKPTVFRLASTLEQEGLLDRRRGGSYSLGLGFVSMARLVLARGLVGTARPFMEELHRSFGHTVNLAVPDQNEVLLVEVLESSHELRVVSPVGAREALHATAMGKALAAKLSPAELDALLAESPLRPLTPNTISSRRAFERELARIRELGFATDEEECRIGGHCVGAAISDRYGPVGAISISATSAQVPASDFPEVGAAVAAAAARISRALGGQPENEQDDRAELVGASVLDA